MKFWRRYWRRRALKRLLPTYNGPAANTLVLAVPVEPSLLDACDSFVKRGLLADSVARDAGIAAATAVREAIPIKIPSHRKFREGGWARA